MSHGSIVRGSLPLYTNFLKSTSIPKTLRIISAKQWSPSSPCFDCRIQAAVAAHSRRSFTTSRHQQAQSRIQPIGRRSAAQSQQLQSDSGTERPSKASREPVARPPPPKQKIAVSRREALRIFGDKLPFEDAQDVLQQIHNLRVDGSLAIEGFSELQLPSSAPVKEEQLLEGLDYLRAQYPLDEEANRESYLQRQIVIAEKSLLARAQDLKLYKRSEGDGDAASSYNAGLSAVDRGSVLVQRRLAREAEKKAEKEADEKAIAEGGEAAAKVAAKEKNRQLVLPWNNAELTPEQHERNAYIEKLRQEAELDPHKILATRTATSRLLQPTIFALIAGGLAYLFAEFYIPPAKESRMWPNTSPALSTCLGLAILNAAVFVAWRRPELWKTLNRNFLLAAGHPRPVSMLGNLFSHQQFGHFSVNMVALMLLGPTVHEEIGRGNFIALFMISGFAGSLANLYWNVLTRNLTTASLGASGCLYGLMGAFFTLKDQLALKIPFSNISLEYSAETGLVVLLALELLAFWRYKGQGGIDHTSHIGGLLAGLLYARLLRARAEASAKAKRMGGGSMTATTE